MSSLYQHLRRGQSKYSNPRHPYFNQVKSITDDLKNNHYTLIRYDDLYAQNNSDTFHEVWKLINSRQGIEVDGRCRFELPGFSKVGPVLDRLIPVRPPFARVWLESYCQDGQAATQIMHSKEPDSDEIMMLCFWRFIGGRADLLFVARCDLTAAGLMPETFSLEPLSFSDIDLGLTAEDKIQVCERLSEQQAADSLKVLQFLNCKNITLESIESGRKRPHVAGKGFSEWKTLTICKVSVKKTGTASEVGERMTRQHLVRGHFADYREGAGLFGRLNGLFWISPHAKGNPEHGSIIKDYSVKMQTKPQ